MFPQQYGAAAPMGMLWPGTGMANPMGGYGAPQPPMSLPPSGGGYPETMSLQRPPPHQQGGPGLPGQSNQSQARPQQNQPPSYADELRMQIEEKRSKEAEHKREIDESDRKFESEHHDPWGQPGAGANGSKTSPPRNQGQQETHPPSSPIHRGSPNSPRRRSMGSPIPSGDGMGPIDQTTRDGEAKKAMVSYQDILKAQVEEKKRIKAEEKEKERLEEEREAARIVEEQKKLKEKFDEELRKQNEKDKRIKTENEERKLEAEKKRE
jgi:hypothetical protein